MALRWGTVPPAQGPLRNTYLKEHGTQSLRLAKKEYRRARRILERSGAKDLPIGTVGLAPEPSSYSKRDLDMASSHIRRQWKYALRRVKPPAVTRAGEAARTALTNAVEALNYLEDSPGRDDAHQWVHLTGVLNAAVGGCSLYLKQGKVWTDCPVRIAHLRIGLSPGLATRRMCSICNESAAQCKHYPDELYEVVADRDARGACTICDKPNCDHTAGQAYLTYPRAVIQPSGPISEISLVRRPRQPLARISEFSLDADPRGELAESVRAHSVPCLWCWGACPGLIELPDGAMGGPEIQLALQMIF